MATITLRSIKGSPLTNDEVDANFNNLNVELGNKLASSNYTASDILTKLKTVDGSGSGLDADTLRGQKFNTVSPGAFVVSAVLRESNTSTIYTASAHGFSIGDTVNVFGITPNTFNGTFTISNVSNTTSFTYTQNGQANVSYALQVNGRCYKTITEASIPDRDINGTLSSPFLVALTTYSNLVGNVTGNLTGNVNGNASNVSGVVSLSNGGTGGTTASEARSGLGLGSLSTQASNSVAITGGTISGLTNALAVADGGTGANNTTTARTNLGLGNVTNESKSTMFTNPVFTGTGITLPDNTVQSTAFSKVNQDFTIQTLNNAGSTVAWDFNLGGTARLVMNGNKSITLANPKNSTYILTVNQDATGSRTITWPSAVKWPYGTVPDLGGANVTTVISLYYNSITGVYYGSYAPGY